MTDQQIATVEVLAWVTLVYLLVLLWAAAWRRFIRSGDVVTQAEHDTAAAALVMADHASIESFVTDWMTAPTTTAIAEAIVVDRQRDHR